MSRSCLELGLADHPVLVLTMPALLPGISHLHVYIADSLFGSKQVRHVDAAVGEPASGHECERRPQVWYIERVQEGVKQ